MNIYYSVCNVLMRSCVIGLVFQWSLLFKLFLVPTNNPMTADCEIEAAPGNENTDNDLG